MMRPGLWLFALFLAGCQDCCNDDSCDMPAPTPSPYEHPYCVGVRPEPEADEAAVECRDEFEPNGDLPIASISQVAHECTNVQKHGILANTDDVDVYRTGNCDAGLGIIGRATTLRPSVTVVATDPIEVCMFPTCHGGSSNVFRCYNDGVLVPRTRTHSYFNGCCHEGAGTIEVEMDCPLYGGTIDTYFWVDAGKHPLTCVPYELDWNI